MAKKKIVYECCAPGTICCHPCDAMCKDHSGEGWYGDPRPPEKPKPKKHKIKVNPRIRKYVLIALEKYIQHMRDVKGSRDVG